MYRHGEDTACCMFPTHYIVFEGREYSDSRKVENIKAVLTVLRIKKKANKWSEFYPEGNR